MRSWISVVSVVMLGVLGVANAETYLENKDAAALAVIARVLEKVDKDPGLFDGTAIPPGADLGRVARLREHLTFQLDQARRGFLDVSDAARRRPDVAKLEQRYRELDQYARALSAVYKVAAAAAQQTASVERERDAATKQAGIATCKAFRTDLYGADPKERTRIEKLADLAGGKPTWWATVEEGEKYRATIAKTAKVCAKPEYAEIGTACAHTTDDEAAWCTAVSRGDELMKLNVMNLAAFHAKHFGANRTAENLAGKDGWIDIEGPTTWKAYFSGEKLREVYRKQLAPMFAQAGMTDLDDSAVFGKLTTHLATLEARARELAPTWKLEGSPCTGVACAAARAIAPWYKAKLRALRQNDAGWKIVKNGLGVPTHRYKGGTILLEVKGDPFCQLRSWTVTESYAGGGRFQSETQATIGYVRWQSCK
jgi:hypothetical protein